MDPVISMGSPPATIIGDIEFITGRGLDQYHSPAARRHGHRMPPRCWDVASWNCSAVRENPVLPRFGAPLDDRRPTSQGAAAQRSIECALNRPSQPRLPDRV
jgi:hypothetical protein